MATNITSTGSHMLSQEEMDQISTVKIPEDSVLTVRTHNGDEVLLPSAVQRMLAQTLEDLKLHGMARIQETPEVLTSNEAADILNVSRPTLLKWADEGTIATVRVGSHRRFRRDDVLKLRQERIEARRPVSRRKTAADLGVTNSGTTE